MKKPLMFHFDGCPYCAEAWRYINELKNEYPELAGVEIERVDERVHPEIADRYDYYYVPTFFLDGVKLHEGASTKKAMELVLRKALEE